MAIIQCPECGEKISDSTQQCIHCGAKIQICPKCGTAHAGNKEICTECGHKFTTTTNTDEQINEPDKEVIKLLEEKKVEKAFRKSDKISYCLHKLVIPMRILCLIFLGIAIYKYYTFNKNLQEFVDITELALSVTLLGARGVCGDIMRELTLFVVLGVICVVIGEIFDCVEIYDKLKIAKWFKQYPFDLNEFVTHSKINAENDLFVASVIYEENEKAKKTMLICSLLETVFKIILYFVLCYYLLWIYENRLVYEIKTLLDLEAEFTVSNIQVFVCIGLAFIPRWIFTSINSSTYLSASNSYYSKHPINNQ